MSAMHSFSRNITTNSNLWDIINHCFQGAAGKGAPIEPNHEEQTKEMLLLLRLLEPFIYNRLAILQLWIIWEWMKYFPETFNGSIEVCAKFWTDRLTTHEISYEPSSAQESLSSLFWYVMMEGKQSRRVSTKLIQHWPAKEVHSSHDNLYMYNQSKTSIYCMCTASIRIF